MRLFIAHMADRFGVALTASAVSALPIDGNYILFAQADNRLVKQHAWRTRSSAKPSNREEAYIIDIRTNSLVVIGRDAAGTFYGLQSLRQLLKSDQGRVSVATGLVEDYPRLPFRGIRLYVPGRDHIPFFKRFIRDFMALYKYNRLILEMNACMRLYKHPELNIGAVQLARYLYHHRLDRPAGPQQEFQDSSHQDAADGGILEQEEVAELVAFARQHFITVIPELPSLTHSYYLLSRHRELAEIQNAKWPDTYCPSEPRSYALYFDVLEEYINVMHPEMIHIGHDEWRMPFSECARCAGKEYADLFVADVNKIYRYLAEKKIKVAMWGDHLVEAVRGRGVQNRETPTGHRYRIPGGVPAAMVQGSIPKDIVVFNWFWGDSTNDRFLSRLGFQQVLGNFRPNIDGWQSRAHTRGLLGGAPSSWAGTTELNFGKDLLYDFLACAQLLWSEQLLTFSELASLTRRRVPVIQKSLSSKLFPEDKSGIPEAVDLSRWHNLHANSTILGAIAGEWALPEIDPDGTAAAASGRTILRKAAAIATGSDSYHTLPRERLGLPIQADVSRLIFWHTLVRPAGNEPAYRLIHNFIDTSDLLGWYEIVYEDGLQISLPVRYGINILDWQAAERTMDAWEQGNTGFPQTVYAYLAQAVEGSKDTTHSRLVYRYEWTNPRPGKTIRHINLKASDRFRNSEGRLLEANAMILLAVELVRAGTDSNHKLKSGR